MKLHKKLGLFFAAGLVQGLLGKSEFVDGVGWVPYTTLSQPSVHKHAAAYYRDGKLCFLETFCSERDARTVARVARNTPRDLKRGAFVMELK